MAGIQEKIFTKIEEYAVMAEQLVRNLAIEEALHTEIKETIEHNNQSHVEWCDLSDKVKNKNTVKIIATCDLGWQKRSSGRRYDSSSGHAFIVGGRSKWVVGMVPYSMVFRKCDAA